MNSRQKHQTAQELYRSGRAKYKNTVCPIAERFTLNVINIPIYPSLTIEKVGEVAKEIIEMYE